MRRPFLVALLALGTIAGFSSGFRGMHHCREQWREAEEARIAEACTSAALAQVKYAPSGTFAPAVTGAGASVTAAPTAAAAAAPGPAIAPIQQISQAPAPIVIITGGYQQAPGQPASVQVVTQPAAQTAPATPTK